MSLCFIITVSAKFWLGSDLPCTFTALITCTPVKKVNFLVLPRVDAGPTLQSAAAGEGQDQLSHSSDPGTSFSCLQLGGLIDSPDSRDSSTLLP